MVNSKTDLDTRLEKILKEVFQAEKIDLNSQWMKFLNGIHLNIMN